MNLINTKYVLKFLMVIALITLMVGNILLQEIKFSLTFSLVCLLSLIIEFYNSREHWELLNKVNLLLQIFIIFSEVLYSVFVNNDILPNIVLFLLMFVILILKHEYEKHE